MGGLHTRSGPSFFSFNWPQNGLASETELTLGGKASRHQVAKLTHRCSGVTETNPRLGAPLGCSAKKNQNAPIQDMNGSLIESASAFLTLY